MKISMVLFLAILGIAPAAISQAQYGERGVGSELNSLRQVTDTFQDRRTDLHPISDIHNLSGRIIRVKEVDTNREGTSAMYVLIQANHGRRVLVDIGSMPNESVPLLKEGALINVTGEFRRIDGRLVFQADTAQTGGRLITVARGVDARVPDSTQNDLKVTRGTQGMLPSYEEDLWKGEYPDSDTRSVVPEIQSIHGRVIQQRFAYDEAAGIQKRMLLLKSDTGRRIVVDLGPAQKASMISIRIGDPVTVNGSVTRFGNRVVFMANTLALADRTYDIDRQKPVHQITGEITKIREVNVHGVQEGTRGLGPVIGKNMVVLLRTKDGGLIKADLGPVQNMRDFELDKGSKISVQGNQVRRPDGLVVMADKVIIGDRLIDIER